MVDRAWFRSLCGWQGILKLISALIVSAGLLAGPAPLCSGQEEETTADTAESEAAHVEPTGVHAGEAGGHDTAGDSEDSHAGAAAEGGAGHADDAHAHDPYDLTHANASDALAAASELRYDHVLGSILVFLVLFALLAKLAWKPITRGLDAREQSIKNMIDEAQRNHEAAAARLREYETRLLSAAEESRAIVAQAQKDAERTAERIKAEAEAAAERERTRALADIQSAKTAALDEVAQRSVDMAVTLAGRIIQKQLNPSDHARLISEAIEQFPSRN